MRLKKWLIALLAAVMSVTTLVAFAACRQDEGQNDQPVTEGPETGVYYYETPLSEEYQIALNNGNQFTFLVMGENKTGTYTLSGESLVLDFARAEDGEVTATLADDVLSLTYNNSSMRFLKKINYTVRFDAGEGSAVPSVTVVNGKTVAEPDAPVYAGHVFVGWYVDEAHSAPFQFGAQPVTSDMTLYALWSARSSDASEYTVNFDLGYTGEGVQAPADVKTVGGVVAELPQPERENYTFLGWYVSAFNSADKLTYEYQVGQQLSEDTTLFALWRDNAATGLAAPEVSVTSEGVTWDRVSGAQSYAVTVTGPDEYSRTSGNISELHYDIDFASLTEGEYTIVVQASASATVTEDAVSSTRYFNNKALARVSGFEIVNSSMLLFEGVPNAQNYYLTIDCGNDEHAHENVALGSDLRYNIANCVMQPGGIRITVRAEAAGYASSEAVYVYNRELAQIEELRFDAATETVSWDRVPDAVGYVVSVGNGTTSYVSNVNIGNTTSYSLKDFAMGDVVFSVYPQTSGYNSPVASTYTYHKATPAVPAGLHVKGNLLRWDTVGGAQTYTVRVNGTEYEVSASQFDLSDYVEDGETFVVQIRANGAAGSSLWSNAQSMNYLAITEAPVYSGGVLSWNPVVGAAYYEVQVNDGEPIRVANDRTSVSVTLTQGGENLLRFRFVDNDGEASEWSDAVAVQAYTIAFDERGGTPVDDIYAAYGDPIVLPSSEQSRYNFGGWYDVPGGAASGGTRFEDAVFMEREDILLYAYWTLRSYQVNLDSEGGSLTSDTASLVYSEGFTLEVPVNSSSRDERYMFYGWYQYPNGAGVRYTDENGDSLVNWTIDENGTTLYAFWLQVFEFGSQTDGYSVRKGPDIGRVTSLRIPVSYNGQPVTALLGAAFEDCTSLREINIPNSIVTIGASDDRSGPFVGCSNLQTINVYEVEGVYDPQYLSIDGVLFETAESGSTTDVLRLASFPMGRTGAYTVPEGVQVLPARIFAATRITSVTLPASLMSIEQTAFYNCDYLTEVNFSATPAGSQSVALTIRSRAFQNCENLREITLPQRLSSFGSDGEDDETVNDAASVFTGCDALQYIYIENNGTTASGLSAKNGLLCDSTGETILYAPLGRSGELTIPDGVVAIGESAFEGRDGLTSVIFPYVVTTIGVDAFRNCEGLRSITFVGLENSPWETSIGQSAFYGCSALREIVFTANSNVVSIGNTAFAYCDQLTTLTLPASVREVGQQAFRDCARLRELTLVGNDDGLTFGDSVFQNCVVLNTINFSASVGEFAFHSVFDGCDNLVSINVDPANQTYSSDDGILFNKDRTSLLFYSRLKGNYEIPESVKTIGASAFADNELITSLTIGANVTMIEAGAFQSLINLTSLNIESGDNALIIGENAFASCIGLTELTLPARVTEVSSGAFMNATQIETLTLNDGLKVIGAQAFSGTGIESVAIPNTVTSLGGGAFAKCASLATFTFDAGGTEDLVLGDSDSSVGGLVRGTDVEAIELPSRLVRIGAYALAGITTLTDLTFEEGARLAELGDYSLAQTALNEFAVPASLTVIGQAAFGECEDLASIDFSAATLLTEIADEAFYGCTSLTEVALPVNLETLGSDVFGGCSKLTAISIDESNTFYTSIDDVLYNAAVTEILVFPANRTAAYTLPETITAIVDDQFADSKVTEVILHDAVTSIGENAFDGSAITQMTIPSGVTSIGEEAFANTEDLESVTFLGNGVTALAYRIFYYSGIQSITLPNRLTSIGNYAFCRSGLVSINIPASVRTIGTYAFASTSAIGSSLTSVTFDANSVLESIGNYAFQYAGDEDADVVSITIPATVTTLGTNLFADSEFTSVSFAPGSAVTMIPRYMFDGAARLTSFTIPANVTTLEGYAFQDSGLESIKIPLSVKTFGHTRGSSTYGSIFSGCTDLATVEFEDSTEESDALTWLGSNMFEGCTSLKSILLPARLTSVPTAAFSGCTSLTTVKFAENSRIKQIGNTAFANTKIASIELPEGLEKLGGDTSTTSANSAPFYRVATLTSIELPASLTTVNPNSFSTGSSTGRNNLANIYVAEGSTTFKDIDGVLFSADGKTLVQYPFGRTAPSYTIPEGTETVGAYAFGLASGTNYYAGKLTSVTFADTVTTIEGYAFNENDSITSLTLPSKLTTISSYAFTKMDGLLSVNLPASVVSIEEHAFDSCDKLATLNIPEDSQLVTIGNYAFKGCMIKSLSLPASLVTLGTEAFRDNAELASLTFAEDGNLTAIGDYAFYGCYRFTTLTIPAYIETIGDYAFYGSTSSSKLEQVIFEKGSRLTTIGARAFQNNKALETIGEAVVGADGETQYVLPASITEIGDNAFYSCAGLQYLLFAEDTSLTTLGNSVFYGCSSLEEIVIPNSVSSIGTGLFGSCTSLETIVLPSSLSEIPNNTFQTTKSLTTLTYHGSLRANPVELPGSVVKIGNNAFQTSAITNIVIPASVTEIGNYTFNNSSVASVTFEGTSLSSLGTYAFKGCKDLVSINLPEGLTELGKEVFINCTSLTEIVLPSTLRTIGESAFEGCENLVEAELLPGITSIGESAFSGCTKLESVTIRATLAEIGANAFANCPNLSFEIDEQNTSFVIENGIMYDAMQTEIVSIVSLPEGAVVIPDTVSSIPAGAFAGSLITSITLPESITEIGNDMFANCVNLEEVTLRGRVTSIGARAFQNCTALKSFEVGRYVESIGANAFENCTNLETLTFESNGVTDLQISNYAFANCTSLGSVTFPYRLRNSGSKMGVGNYSFENCTSLKSVSFEESSSGSFTVGLSLGSYSFSGCTGLITVSLPDYLTNTSESHGGGGSSGTTYYASIGSYAFQNCSKLSTIDFGDTINKTTRYLIGDYAFRNCTSLTTLRLPDKLDLSDTGNDAFNGCSNLSSVSLPAAGRSRSTAMNDDLAVERVFAGCHALATVEIRESFDTMRYKDSESETYREEYRGQIGESWFMNCTGLTTVTFTNPASIYTIRTGAFMNCSKLTNFELPEGLAELGGAVFAGCSSISSMTLPEGLVTLGISTYSSTGIYDGLGVFTGTAITSLVIPSTVTSIMPGAFAGCALQSLTVAPAAEGATAAYVAENNVLYNAEKTLLVVYASSNTEFTIPASVTEIEEYAFSGSAIESITIPATVQYIGEGAFSDCIDLTTVVFEGSVGVRVNVSTTYQNQLADFMFAGCTSLESVTLPEDLEVIGASAFDGCGSLTSIQLPSTLKTLDERSFAETGFTSFEIPASLLATAYSSGFVEGALAGCSNLTAITVAEGNANYVSVDGVLYSADKTILLAYPAGKTDTSFVVPEGVLDIAAFAFAGATHLESVTIASTVTTMGSSDYGPFVDCPNLKEIKVAQGNSVYSVVDGVLYEHKDSDLILVAYLPAREGDTFVVEIPEGFTGINRFIIGGGAFIGANLKHIYLTGDVSTVRSNAFEGWTSEQNIYVVMDDAPYWTELTEGGVTGNVVYINAEDIPDSTSPETPAEGAQQP